MLNFRINLLFEIQFLFLKIYYIRYVRVFHLKCVILKKIKSINKLKSQKITSSLIFSKKKIGSNINYSIQVIRVKKYKINMWHNRIQFYVIIYEHNRLA